MEGYASEQEQLESIRKWWGQNGKSLVLGLAVGITGLAGYRYWDESRNLRAESASVNYDQFLGLASKKNLDDTRQAGKTILDSYPESTYARLTALYLAKLEVEADKPAAARERLQWVLEHHGKDGLDSVARARLAQLSLAEGKPDAAWQALEEGGLTAGDRYAELKGDILAARGKTEEAIAMYNKAQAEVAKNGGNLAIIELKLERLGHAGEGA